MPTLDIPINKGTLPDFNTQLGYPKLFNWFVGESGYLYPTPGLALISAITGIRKIHYTVFDGGRFVVVTDSTVYRVSKSGALNIIASITNSGEPVFIAENLQNQVVIVDGQTAWLYDQAAGGTFNEITETQGLQLQKPGSATAINSFIVILDTGTGYWQASAANNANSYNALQIQEMDSQSGVPIAVATVDDGLFIFGSIGIERWQPTIVTNPFLPPFQKDMTYKDNLGVISANSIFEAVDKVYFLSSYYIPMELSKAGVRALTPDGDSNPKTSGIAKIFSQYTDIEDCYGTFYSFAGNFYYHLSFLKENISWVWCVNSKKYCLSDDLVVSASNGIQTIATSQGIYNLTFTLPYKHRYWISERTVNYKGQQPVRNLLNGCEVRITQGESQPKEPQYLELQTSLDSISWSNTVKKPIGLTGKRNDRTIWNTNVASPYEFTFRLDYYGASNICIEKFTATIN